MRKFLSILKTIGPAILAMVPGGAIYAPLILAGVELAERTGQPGATKRDLGREAVRIGAQAAQTSGAPISPAEAVDLYDKSIDATISAVNLVKKLTPDEPPAAVSDATGAVEAPAPPEVTPA